MLSEIVGCCKWFGNRSVAMLFNYVEGMTTKSTVLREQKESTSKVQILCPDVPKIYSQGMGGVDLVNQKTAAYNLNVNHQFAF